jgi:integrase
MITDKSIQKALKVGKAVWLKDPGDRGSGRLGLHVRTLKTRVTAEFYAISFRGGKRRMAKLGTYPAMSLSEARKRFQVEFSPRITAGEAPRIRAAEPLGSLTAAYVADLRSRGAKVANIVEHILGHAARAIGKDRPASSITPADIVPHLAAIHARGAEVQANTVRAYLSACFAYGLKAEHDFTRKRTGGGWGLTVNPVAAIPPNASANRVGNRFLSPAELRTLWHWLLEYRERSLIASALLLRIATGQRSEEVLRITEASYEKGRGMVHWERTKNGRPHSIPLPRQAIEVMERLYPNSHGLYFWHQFDPAKPAGQQSMQEVVKKFLSEHRDFAPFTARDIRRTWKTLAGDAGISKEMRDRLQNHVEGGVSAKHYDRYDYLPERRAAMDRWSDYLDRVISGAVDGAEVIQLRAEGEAA